MSNFLGIFDGCDIEGLSALIDKLEKSSFDFLKLEGEGMSVVIGKNGACEMSHTAALPTVTQSAVPALQYIAEDPGTTDCPENTNQESQQAKSVVYEEEGQFVIRAPSQGLFFAQPEPGSPPYVTIGSTVKAGDTVGLMEIMKTYSALTSPVDGEVIAIHVVNEEYLEPDQALVSIKIK